MQAIFLGDRSKHEGSFHQCELVANALAWATTKGEIRIARTVLCAFRREPLWIEAFRRVWLPY